MSTLNFLLVLIIIIIIIENSIEHINCIVRARI